MLRIFPLALFALTPLVWANDCIKTLQDSLANNPSNRIVRFVDSYECLEGNACAVTFEHDSSPYPNSFIMAYRDEKHAQGMEWGVMYENRARGWTSSGTYSCAEVKNYFDTEELGPTFEYSFERRTAYDTMFCPVSRVFFKYSAVCHRL